MDQEPVGQGQNLHAEVWLEILDPAMSFEAATAEAEAAGNKVLRCEEANPETGEPRRLVVVSVPVEMVTHA